MSRPAAILVLFSFFMTLMAPPTWAQAPVTRTMKRHTASIIKIAGRVEIRKSGRKDWQRARKGSRLRTGDRIRTGPKGKAKIKIGDVGEITIRPGSEARIGDLKQIKTPARAFFFLKKMVTRDDIGLDLTKGDIRASFNKKSGRVGNYNVYTPVAVAGVRGTKFELDLEGGKAWYESEGDDFDEGKGQGFEQSLMTTVLEGLVEVAGSDWSRSVGAGQQLFAEVGKMPGEVTTADPQTMESLAEEFKDINPPAFSGVKTIQQPTPSSLTVSWTDATDDVTPSEQMVYEIYLAMKSGAQNFVIPTAITVPGATQYTVSDLLDNTNYYVVVRAKDQAGNKDSNNKQVSTFSDDVTPPVFVGATSAELQSEGDVLLKWPKASDDVTPSEEIIYEIYGADQINGFDYSSPTVVTEPGVTSYLFRNLDMSKDYFAVIRAVDETGNKDENVKIVSTASIDVTVPAFSGVNTVKKLSDNTFIVDWQPATDDGTEQSKIVYDLYVATEDGGQDFAIPTVSTEPGAVKHEFTDVEEDRFYFVVVRARDESGNREKNTRQVSTWSEDQEIPLFEGLRRAREVAEGTIALSWEAASDNRTSVDDMIYDIYVAAHSGRQDFMSDPVATSSPGVKRHLLELPNDPLPIYYIVVKARDEAGLHDDNEREITVTSPTFIARAVENLIGQLFEAYTDGSADMFMALVSPSFVGVNSAGNVITYATLGSVIEEDFNLLSSVVFNGNVTSIQEAEFGKVSADILWSARFQYASSGEETVKTGARTKLRWDVSSRDIRLVGWEGASPFGLTEALSGDVLTGAVPLSLYDLEGNFNFSILGDFTDFSGRTFTVRGEGFQEGSKLEHFSSREGFWTDVTGNSGDGTIVDLQFVSSRELRMTFQKFTERYRPGDELQQQELFRVVNPDGEISNEVSKTVQQNPGPLSISGLRISPQEELEPVPDQNPYSFELAFFNFATQDRELSSIGRTQLFIAQTGSSDPDQAFEISDVRRAQEGNSDQDPLKIIFDVRVISQIQPGSTYEVVMVDDRGQTDRWQFKTAQAGFPILENIEGLSNFQINGDFQDFAPMTWTVRGQNFRDGMRLEIFEDEQGSWDNVANDQDGSVRVTTEFVSANEIRLNFQQFLMQYFPDDRNDEQLRFRVVDPENRSSNELTRTIRILPGPFRIVSTRINPSVINPAATSGEQYQIEADFYNFVFDRTAGQFNNRILIQRSNSGSHDPAFEINNIRFNENFGEGQGPITMTMDFRVNQDIDPSQNYDFVMRDDRGQQEDISLQIGAAGPPVLQEVDGDFNFNITGDWTDFGGRLFTIRGSGFQQGSVLESMNQGEGVWEVVGDDAPNFTATINFVNSQEMTLTFNTMRMSWHAGENQQGSTLTEQLRFRIRNPDGATSNEVTQNTTISAGPLNLVTVLETNPGNGVIANQSGRHSFDLSAYNMVFPVTITISLEGSSPQSSSEWTNIVIEGGNGSEDETSADVLRFAADFAGPIQSPHPWDIAIRDGRGQLEWVTVDMDNTVPTSPAQ
ncbi:MAG: fibronectin type III domain-containing protein [Candidatus Lindowbacteria bacterium]|nr:fibronectin type III domain-containing protein [Candidatus Lindowbacteria bacterium]